MSKYKNQKAEYNGITFDSKAERDRYIELTLLQKAGKIRNLQCQVPFLLIPKQESEREVKYYCDFEYFEQVGGRHRHVVEDVKSKATAKDKCYILKRKLFKMQFPSIAFREEIR